jgi:hypothetical protein
MGHQYAGAPTYPVSFQIPDDGDAKTAASINVALQALGDRTTQLNRRVPSAANFPFRAPPGATSLYDFAFLAPLRRWVFLGKDSTTVVRPYTWDAHTSALVSFGNTATVGAANAPVGLALHPTAVQFVMVTDFSGTTSCPVTRWDSTSGTVTTTNVAVSNARGIGITYFGGAYTAFFRTATVCWVFRSTDGVTWGSAVSSIGNTNARQMQFASSGTTCVALHQNTTGNVTNPYVAQNVVYVTTDGITWSQRTVPISAFWTGITYDASRGLFVIVGSDTTNRFKVYTSPDGATWTQAGSGGGKVFAARPFGIAAHGERWLLAAIDTVSSYPFVAASSDAGDSWGIVDVSPAWDGGTLNGGVGLEPRPVANGAQCVLATDTATLASLVLTPNLTIAAV